MRSIKTTPSFAIIACVLGTTAPSWAQEQIKPYFDLIFDTSGSMGGVPLTQAKSAVLNIVNSTGDAEFALQRFAQTCSPNTDGCGCTGACAGELLVGIFTDNQNWITEFVDGDACDYNGPDGVPRWNAGDDNIPEFVANGNTPLALSMAMARTYYQTFVLNAWGDAIIGDGDLVNEVAERWNSPIAADYAAVPPVDQCRPYGVILLTDGVDNCPGDPPTEATLLRSTWVDHDGDAVIDAGETYDVLTYVIGFRVAAPSAALEAIATNGGTDAPGANRAFYPGNDVELSAALSQIIQDSLLIEVCNGADDDCDTFIDEGVTNACDARIDLTLPPAAGTCGPVVEVCDSLPAADEDCDGSFNEGFTLYCDRPGGHIPQDLCVNPGETVCDGIDDNCNGIIDEGGICGGCVPGPEICDNIDNDCDGSIDEGLVRACGTDVGECTVGQQECRAGVWGWDEGAGFVPGECSGIDPIGELCNNLDDDCNGVVDGQVRACGSDVGECQGGSQRCTAGAWGVCVGEIGPVAEICDGLDNDCDGVDDDGNPGGGAPCGSDVGECVEGAYECIGGELVCDDVGPSPEVCDGLDNDCDDLIDEGNPEGGGDCGLTDEGECELGVEQCLGGEIVCIGEVGPEAEVCDNRDNDCDGLIDEGNPGGGAECGTDEGECEPGTLDCIGGELLCIDEVGPSEEICDGLDNDCDGAVDEGIPIGAPCGSDVGECEPGAIECVDGVEDCVGGVGPVGEICDGLDNDCDGLTDEGLGLGDPCGIEEGNCEPGSLECVDGEILCVGGRGPADETCDCDDEDCDGEVDEDPDICPGGACIDCSCRSPCDPSVEFSCPAGLDCACEDLNGDGVCCQESSDPPCGEFEYFCLGDRCADVKCEEPAVCDPSTGACADPCAGIICEDPLRCDSDAGGRCAPNDCYNFPEDCAEDEACVDGLCAPAPCAGVSCLEDEYCSDGDCVRFCDDVDCGSGERCVDGDCVPDLCADRECGRDSWCNPDTGECQPDLCDRACPVGRVCDPLTGDCIDDPCNVTECPEGYECDEGICSRDDGGTDSDADADADTDVDADADTDATDPDRRGLATGGGGCVCSVPSGGGEGAGPPLWALLLGLVVVVRRRAR